jgi:ABC-type branched-subunit amino acid transport system ATPase component
MPALKIANKGFYTNARVKLKVNSKFEVASTDEILERQSIFMRELIDENQEAIKYLALEKLNERNRKTEARKRTKKKGVTEEIQDISEKLGLTAYIANFTEGYATIVNPEAHFIPADVVRKILLARALVGQPLLVMIESPAASLNPEQIETVINTLNAQPNCTMLIATQDRNILSMCDRIIEIKNGQLIA